MNYLLKCFLILLVNLILSKSLFADENKFICMTENFLVANTVWGINERDEEYETRNLNRKYLLTITEKDIILTDTNIKNKNSQDSYRIITRVSNTKDIMSVGVSPIGVRTLVFNTEDKIGTKTLQGSFYTYVSRLRCS